MLRELITQDLYLGFLLLSLFLVTLVRFSFNAKFSDFFNVVWNDRYLKIYSRDRKQIDVFGILLSVNYVLITAIFICISLPLLGVDINGDWSVLTIIFGLLLGYFLIRILIDRFIAFSFDSLDFGKFYKFQKTTYKNYTGLLLIPAVVLLLFSNFNPNTIIYLTITVILLINLIGFVRFLRLFQNEIISNLFYFLLYLCALEIGPYIVLCKIIRTNFE